MKSLSERATFLLSPALVLAFVFSSLYLALGPGCLFSVDEVVVQEMAQAVFLRRNVDVPYMLTAKLGVGGNYYAHRGPALGYTAVPLVALGTFLDDRWGSMRGTAAAGAPLGTPEHPLGWGGRLAAFTALALSALLGGITVAALYLIALRFGLSQRAAVLAAIAAGSSTLLGSESTHFFQHLLAALTLLLGFLLLSDRDLSTLTQRAFFGPLSLGIAVLARPDAAPPAAVLWLYGAWVAWQSATGAERTRRLLHPALAAVAGPLASVGAYLWYNNIQFGSFTEFGYNTEMERFYVNAGHVLKGIAAFSFSPTLSVFLFSPLLILAVPLSRRALRLWPLESRALLAAAASHLLLICFFRTWHGGVAYGPRYLLPSILLVLPLMFPAMGYFLYAGPRVRCRTVAVLIGLGVLVQLLGAAVWVTTSQWYRIQHGISEDDAWVFVTRASPVWLHL